MILADRYLLVFYWAINVGAFFGLATSYAAVSLAERSIRRMITRDAEIGILLPVQRWILAGIPYSRYLLYAHADRALGLLQEACPFRAPRIGRSRGVQSLQVSFFQRKRLERLQEGRRLLGERSSLCYRRTRWGCVRNHLGRQIHR